MSEFLNYLCDRIQRFKKHRYTKYNTWTDGIEKIYLGSLEVEKFHKEFVCYPPYAKKDLYFNNRAKKNQIGEFLGIPIFKSKKENLVRFYCKSLFGKGNYHTMIMATWNGYNGHATFPRTHMTIS